MKATLITALLALCSASAWAKNVTENVGQVKESVTLSSDVDYVITAPEPFDAMGSVNIENTDHAVLIIQDIRPSLVISKWLPKHVFIKGAQAVDGKNCQVRMFGRGAIVLPYASTLRPLTCFTEENYGGTSCDTYTEGHAGGFMKSLTATNLNNQIRSFKLKRGYMVTFAVGTAGWGYSRCFIADMEDLEIPVMPAPFKGTISSFRLFKWYNASKAGVHHTGKDANAALRTTSCFDWGQGNGSLLPDVEWISHHIYEDWPSASACGSVSQTCHMKTNNEPGNSADDHPQDVETVLNNWQNLMRTGMRLCSESSHDGSMNHLKTFIDEIDKRGWRCDILDLHCYWDGQFNSLDWYIQEYGKGRPCWISEWVWGSSWGHNGAFADGRQSDNATYNGTVPILERLNKTAKVERYFYWNSEQWYTNIWRDGGLTKLGQYYAEMDVPLAYNAQNEYVPKIVFSAPTDLSGTFTKRTGKVEISWTDPNGDMLDSIAVEYKAPGSSRFVKLANVELKDMDRANGVTYNFTTTATELGLHEYQVKEYYTVGTSKKTFTTKSYTATVAAASAAGDLQFGQLKIADAEYVTTDLTPSDAAPYVVMGLVSNKNTANGVTNQLASVSKTSFKFRLLPWQLTTPIAFSNAETVDYMALPADTVYHLPGDVMLISAKTPTNIKGEVVNVEFPEAFPEGCVPVVVAQQSSTVTSLPPVSVRVSNVTNKGFDVQLLRQDGVTTTFASQKVTYFACTPCQLPIGGGKLLSVGRNDKAPIGGAARINVDLLGPDGQPMALLNPVIVAAAQTHNYAATNVLRQHTTLKDDNGAVTGLSVRRQIDPTTKCKDANSAAANGDLLGYIIISDDPNGSSDDAPLITPVRPLIAAPAGRLMVSVSQGVISCSSPRAKVFNSAGQQVSLERPLPAGIYVVTDGLQSRKVIVK